MMNEANQILRAYNQGKFEGYVEGTYIIVSSIKSEEEAKQYVVNLISNMNPVYTEEVILDIIDSMDLKKEE